MTVNIGDVVQLITAKVNDFRFVWWVTFQSGLQDFDKTQSFASVGTVQKILGKPASYITDIQVKLKDVMRLPRWPKNMPGYSA